MLRKALLSTFLIGSAVAFIVAAGCSQSPSPSPIATDLGDEHSEHKDSKTGDATAAPHEGHSASEEHGHQAGAHGGMIVSLGRDSYHVEAIVTDKGEIRLYTLGNDESRIQDVEVQDLVAYVKPEGGADSTSIDVKPQPQPGDAPGKASLFVGQLPSELIGKNIDVTIPNITIGGERFRLGFTNKSDEHGKEEMPGKVSNEAERELYLTPGGAYTQADIEANGNVTVSQKFATFMAAHDLHPKIGDKICPITLTKANPKCSWIVGGKTYEFCCPPCVDEFVKLAKSKPEDVKQPEFYVKRDTNSADEN